jgi:K+-transporting ATPase A subunit
LRVEPSEEQTWRQYTVSLLMFSAARWLALYAVLRTRSIRRLTRQMAGITVASFTSKATGMAVAAAVIRGLAR